MVRGQEAREEAMVKPRPRLKRGGREQGSGPNSPCPLG